MDQNIAVAVGPCADVDVILERVKCIILLVDENASWIWMRCGLRLGVKLVE